MKILIMGLSGSGKTFLSKLLQKELSCAWYNADNLREMANDCGENTLITHPCQGTGKREESREQRAMRSEKREARIKNIRKP